MGWFHDEEAVNWLVVTGHWSGRRAKVVTEMASCTPLRARPSCTPLRAPPFQGLDPSPSLPCLAGVGVGGSASVVALTMHNGKDDRTCMY